MTAPNDQEMIGAVDASLGAQEPWEIGVTYVIGHQRPDTDAIASALAYTWYLTTLAALPGPRTHPALQSAAGESPVLVAARTGPVPAQAQFALKRFEVAPPRLLTEAAPTFGHVVWPQATVAPDDPLWEATARLSQGGRVVPVVDAAGKPLGMVTPLALARAFSGPASAGEPLAQPCRLCMEPVPAFEAQESLSDHRAVLLRSETDDFLVVDSEGLYRGVASRRAILEPPRARLVLVDHNELDQAVTGAAEAEIVAVLDHHRLGNSPTVLPIPFLVEPVGSTCTLVAEACFEHHFSPPPGLAGMMLSGILSDTLVFRSPTTTERDRAAGVWLAEVARQDARAYGEELLRAAPGLSARAAGEVLDGDRKSYQMGGRTISIAQVEVTSFMELPERHDDLVAALDDLRQREGLALAGLMITDVVTGRSRLLCAGEARILAALPFPRMGANEFELGEIVSRKKQLVPALHAVLEERV